MDLVHHQWSGKHHGVVKGIGLLTVLWTDGDRHLPCDYRLYDKVTDGKTKNDHFRDLLQVAKGPRVSRPECVLFDGWYSGLENLKKVRDVRLALADADEVQPPGEPRADGPAGR